jgi:MFS transporter, OPA family, glycerol-3-phosphate transporter
MGAFIGYAAYYLVRKNLALAIPGMIQPVESGGLGYTKLQLGIALSAISIAYAFSKFIMGALSDRSDARKFLVIGLILSAILMMSVGLFPFATSAVWIIFLFMLSSDGSEGWDGLPADASWCTGSRTRNEASRWAYGTPPTL